MENEKILSELEKSGQEFSNLFVRNNAEFVELPKSGVSNKEEENRYAAQIGDVTMVAAHNSRTATWKFRPLIVGFNIWNQMLT